MATYTTNYNLTKPGTMDAVDISVLNDNFDAIDAQMKENADAAEGAVTDVAYSGGALTKTINGTTTNVFTTDNTPTEDSTNPLTSGGAYAALEGKQDALTFDDVPTRGSTNPVESGGVYEALSGKEDSLTYDGTPMQGSSNPVTSGGIYDVLANKQDTLTFDSAPTSDSTNPVTSGGVHAALAGKEDALTFDSAPTEGSSNPVTSGGAFSAIKTVSDAVDAEVQRATGAESTIAQAAADAATAAGNAQATINNALAPAYDATATYAVGDYVMYQGSLYKCSTAIATPEAWTAGHWTAAQLAPTVADIKEDLSDLSNQVNQLLEDRIASMFIAQRTGRVWKRKVWKTSANTTPECPALDSYNDGVATPFTDTVAGSDPYMDKYNVFRWFHCNYFRDADGTARPTALEGEKNYATTGSVDIGTLRPTFWWKHEDTDSSYFTLHFSDSPNEDLGLVPWVDAVKTDGTVLPYFIVSSYASVRASDGKLRSQKGKPANNASYNNIISPYQSKGSGYWGSGSSIMTLAMIDLIVKYQTKLEQNVFSGNSSFIVNEPVLVAETGVKRVLISASSTKFAKGDGVTVGTNSGAYWLNGSVVSWAEITKVETVEIDGTSYKALTLDVSSTFNTATNYYVVSSACPSGQTDGVMGHYDGSIVSNTDNKHALRIGGVEHMNGLWFVFADTVIDFASGSWKVYVAPKGTAHVANAHTNYKLIGTSTAFTSDAYVGNVGFDTETGGFYHLERGSSSALGTGAHHWNGGTPADGTLREWLGVGALTYGAFDGFATGHGGNALSNAHADFGSRD